MFNLQFFSVNKKIVIQIEKLIFKFKITNIKLKICTVQRVEMSL